MKPGPVEQRVRDVATAKRCIRAVAAFMRRCDSPLGAEDLEQSARVLERAQGNIVAIRRAVADYMKSEGCGCCSNRDAHDAHAKRLATLLRVPPYKDGSGHDFTKFRSR